MKLQTIQTPALQMALTCSALLLFCPGCAHLNTSQPQVEFSLQKISFPLGESRLPVQQRQFGRNSLTFVNLHDDEQASVDAAIGLLETRGGRLIELVHTGKRRVEFSWKGKTYNFDPNRIFSSAGVRLTVRGQGAIPEEVYSEVEKFAQAFVRYFRLADQPALIALHNNDEGNLSIHSYAPGQSYQADTDRLHIEPGADPDDFCFVTSERAFTELQRRKINVVLQDNRIRRDDGSLSVFSGRHGIPYINVEAEPAHQAEQTRMLQIAIEILK